jgi:1-acyl-sn-glycerol-3-phosphate acyltransferase
LDIFVLNSVFPLRFIAKNEVRDWFLIGWLCRRTETLFIKRATRQHLIEMNQTVADALENQDRIGLFPEGTTTEGCQVSEFYPALFQGAVDAAAPILPVCVYYHDPQGKHSQLAAYAGETSLLSSIWQILRCHDLHVTLTFFPVLSTVDSNRRTLAHATHHTISQHLTTATHQAQAQAQDNTALPYVLLPNCSAYALLLDPIINQILR